MSVTVIGVWFWNSRIDLIEGYDSIGGSSICRKVSMLGA